MVGSIKKVRGVGLVEVYLRISQNLMVIGRPVKFPNMCKSNLFAKSYKSVETKAKFKVNICFQIIQVPNISLVPS